MISNIRSKIRFYRKELPEKEDIVMVKIIEGNEYGYNVSLLEYEDMSGFVNLAQLSKKRRRRKKKIVKEGQVIPMVVTRVYPHKKTVDLSKRLIIQEEVPEIEKEFQYNSNFNKLGNEIYCKYSKFLKERKESDIKESDIKESDIKESDIKESDIKESDIKESDIEAYDIMENTIWTIFDQNKDKKIDDLFYETLNEPNNLFETNFFSPDFANQFIKDIKSRTIRKSAILEMDINVVVTQEDGISTLKDIFNITLDDNDNDNNKNKLEIVLISPPLYKIKIVAESEKIGTDILNRISGKIKEKTLKYGGKFNICDKIKIVKKCETDIKFLTRYELNKIINQ